MPKAFSLSMRLHPRRVIEPAVLALLVAGGAGAYALRSEAGAAAGTGPGLPPRLALAVSYQPDGPIQAGFAAIEPARAEQALLQVAVLHTDPAPFAQSFEAAFRPMTAGAEVRRPLLARLAAEPAFAPADVPVGGPAAALPAAAPVPEAASPPAAPDPAPAAVIAAPPPSAELAAPVPEPVPEVAAPPEPEPASVVAAAPPPDLAPAVLPVAEADAAPSVPALAMAAVPVMPGPAAAPVAASAASDPALVAAAPVPAAPAAAAPLVPVAAPPALAAPPKPKPALTKARPSAPLARAAPARAKVAPPPGLQIPSRYKLVEGGVETQIGVQMYGERLGSVPLQVLGSGLPSLRLGDLLGLVKSRLAPGQYERLSASAAAEEYVSLDTLRKAGIPVRYDAARDELKLGED